jgi:hypothetical protein
MRHAWVILLASCGFPDVRYNEAGADGVDVVSTGCKTNADCKPACLGIVPMCGCVAYIADSAAPPMCDSTCIATGCLNKNAVCIDGGTCVIQ